MVNFEFLANIPWFGSQLNKDTGTNFSSASMVVEQTKQRYSFDLKLWGWSLLLVVPWDMSASDKIKTPTTINRQLKRRAQSRELVANGGGSGSLRFRPYVSKVPWHTGARAFLSQLFPRYGHYCGPNWSSGKDGGTLVWDKRPIDWLDFCCYCHDIGYDTHDQATLLQADLAFLECLERPNMSTKGDARVALLYKTMCLTGLKNLLIPYRRHLVGLQSWQPMVGFGWLGNIKWSSNLRKT